MSCAAFKIICAWRATDVDDRIFGWNVLAVKRLLWQDVYCLYGSSRTFCRRDVDADRELIWRSDHWPDQKYKTSSQVSVKLRLVLPFCVPQLKLHIYIVSWYTGGSDRFGPGINKKWLIEVLCNTAAQPCQRLSQPFFTAFIYLTVWGDIKLFTLCES